MIDDSKIKFDKKMVKVRNVSFPKSCGLIELLFKKQHNKNSIPVSNRSILQITSAHMKRYGENSSLRTSHSRKYKNIIEP